MYRGWLYSVKLFSISMGIMQVPWAQAAVCYYLGRKNFLALIQQRDLTALP